MIGFLQANNYVKHILFVKKTEKLEDGRFLISISETGIKQLPAVDASFYDMSSTLVTSTKPPRMYQVFLYKNLQDGGKYAIDIPASLSMIHNMTEGPHVP